jgi:hypothetical protein
VDGAEVAVACATGTAVGGTAVGGTAVGGTDVGVGNGAGAHAAPITVRAIKGTIILMHLLILIPPLGIFVLTEFANQN